MLVRISLRQIEWVMSHHHLDERVRHLAKPRNRCVNLLAVQSTPSADDQCAGTVESNDRYLRIDVRWLQIDRDVAALLPERMEKPRGDVVQRHVVVSWYDHRRERQPIEERAGT